MRPPKTLLLLLFLGVLTACDRGEPAASDPTGPETVTAAAPGACTDLKALQQDLRGWFPMPERQAATDHLKTLGSACNASQYETVAASAWQILRLAEAVLNDGTAGSPVVGAAMVAGRDASTAGLLDCISDASGTCAPSAEPAASAFVGPMSLAGTFGVRDGGTSGHALARAPLMYDDDGVSDWAWWGLGVESGSTWGAEVWGDASRSSLLYGAPKDGPPQSLEEPVGDIDYTYHVFPDPDGFAGQVEVGVCFYNNRNEPDPGPTSNVRIQRRPDDGSDLLLEFRVATFCDGLLQAASAPFDWDTWVGGPSVVGSLVAAAEWLFLPRPLHAAALSHPPRSANAGATDFSTMTPVEAATSGSLHFLVAPPARVVTGDEIEVVVQARSGNGTPMEYVRVEVYVAGNSGESGGAFFVPSPLEGYTEEIHVAEDGTEYYGALSLTGRIFKSGGYMVCARVYETFAGFTFSEACTDLFQIVPNG